MVGVQGGTTSAPGLGSPLPTSAPGLGSPLPHLHRDQARRCHICAGISPRPCHTYTRTGLTCPHLRRDWAHTGPHLHWDSVHPCHICSGTRPAPPTSAFGLGPPRPHLHRDWAYPPTSAPGMGSPRPHLRRDWAHPIESRHVTVAAVHRSSLCCPCSDESSSRRRAHRV